MHDCRCIILTKYDIFDTVTRQNHVLGLLPQRADSDSESPPERPGTQTSGYFHIKHVMQQAKSHHM